MSLLIILMLAVVATCQEENGGQWKVIRGMDNLNDLRPCCTYGLNISTLQQMCLSDKWCAGFSSYFGVLKYSVANLGPQANTDTWVRVPAPPPLPPPAPSFLWPRPSSYTFGNVTLAIQPESFRFTNSGVPFPMLTATLARYVSILQIGPASASGAAVLSGCAVEVASSNTDLFLGVDESYTLHVDIMCRLTANTIFGAIRGLETFVGLWDTPDRTFPAAPLSVSDAPRFPYRGLMVDTARHFLPIPVLLDHIEAMSASKLNVFHWHLIDQQSWPLNLSSLPLAALAASYDPTLATYSASDVATVVAAAYARGIRVIAELDMPAGHFSSILRGYPSLGAGLTADGYISSNLDPSNPEVWSVLDGLFRELAGMFPDSQIHIGFDEVTLQDWNTTKISAWMAKMNMTSLVEVESFFLTTIRSIAAKYNRLLIIWDDPVGEGVTVPKDVTLQVWNSGMDLVRQLTTSGYNVTYSSPFYLDNLANTWDVIYAQSDLDEVPPILNLQGAEACMWGEQVDVTNAESRVWPRAAALAELLWSGGFETYPRIPQMNAARMEAWRCRVRGRGVAANPIQPGWCPRAPH